MLHCIVPHHIALHGQVQGKPQGSLLCGQQALSMTEPVVHSCHAACGPCAKTRPDAILAAIILCHLPACHACGLS